MCVIYQLNFIIIVIYSIIDPHGEIPFVGESKLATKGNHL